MTLGRFEELEAKLATLERANLTNEERDSKRFDNLTRLVKDATDRIDKTSATLQSRLDGAAQDDQRIRGTLEEIQFNLSKLARDTEVLRKAAEERWALNFSAAPVQDMPQDADGLLAYGQKMLEAGQTGPARGAFVEFLKKFNTDPRGPLAHYGLGRAYYGERQMKQAVREFGEAFKAWQSVPASKAPPEAPESLWYAGLALESLDCKKSKDMLKFLRQSYPKSSRAAEAKDYLANMKCR